MAKRAEGENGERAAEALESDGDSGLKRQRTDGEDGEDGKDGEGEAANEGGKTDFSNLPNDILWRIVGYLPLRYAIRTAVLSTSWRGLWMEQPHKIRLFREILPRQRQSHVEALVEEVESLAGQRVEHLSLVVNAIAMKAFHFRRFMLATANCAVEDLHIDLRNARVSSLLKLHLPLLSRKLARLSLRRTCVSNLYLRGAVKPFPELAAIYFQSVGIETRVFDRMLALCPSLRVLDLRRCFGLDAIVITAEGPNLSSLTITGCDSVDVVNVMPVSSLHSFRYSGRFLPHFYLLAASVTDLYICYNGPVLRRMFENWFPMLTAQGFPTLFKSVEFNLTNLTFCSNALQIMSFWRNVVANTERHQNFSFQRLRELQLRLCEMKAEDLANIYLFLKTCGCPNLTRLFVQFPKIRHEPRQENLLDLNLPDFATEEPPEYGFENLTVVRITNFNWYRIDVQLVVFLLRNARNIGTLQLVTQNAIPLNVAGVAQVDLSLVREALAKGLIVLTETDAGAIQPFHSENIDEI